MRILQANKFWRQRAGSERYVFELCDLLESHGHQIYPFAMQDAGNAYSQYSSLFVSPMEISNPWRVPLHRRAGVALRLLHSREAARSIGILADVAEAEIAHIHNIYHHLSPSIFRPLARRGIGIVMTVHDYKLICPALRLYRSGEVCQRCHRFYYLPCVAGRCVKDSWAASMLGAGELFVNVSRGAYTKHVDRFIAPSRFMAQRMVEGGLPADRVEVLPGFVDTGRWKPSGSAGDYVLYSGWLSPEKGVQNLIRAMALHPDVPLKVAGIGSHERVLRSLARELGISNVDFVGFRKDDDIVRLVQGSRFVCVPSEWYESSPMSALEAFACGRPVLASRIGGIPETVVENETGILVGPGDVEGLAAAIGDLWHNPERCQELGRAARRLAEERFSPEDHYGKIKAIYEQVSRA